MSFPPLLIWVFNSISSRLYSGFFVPDNKPKKNRITFHYLSFPIEKDSGARIIKLLKQSSHR